MLDELHRGRDLAMQRLQLHIPERLCQLVNAEVQTDFDEAVGNDVERIELSASTPRTPVIVRYCRWYRVPEAVHVAEQLKFDERCFILVPTCAP